MPNRTWRRGWSRTWATPTRRSTWPSSRVGSRSISSSSVSSDLLWAREALLVSTSDIRLDTRLSTIFGAKTADAVAETLSLETVGDLLRHYPRRYHVQGELT